MESIALGWPRIAFDGLARGRLAGGNRLACGAMTDDGEFATNRARENLAWQSPAFSAASFPHSPVHFVHSFHLKMKSALPGKRKTPPIKAGIPLFRLSLILNLVSVPKECFHNIG